MEGKVLRIRDIGVPFSNGWYRLGSKVSGAAIPPAIHKRMQLSAFAAGCSKSSPIARGARAIIAAAVLAVRALRKSRLCVISVFG